MERELGGKIVAYDGLWYRVRWRESGGKIVTYDGHWYWVRWRGCQVVR